MSCNCGNGFNERADCGIVENGDANLTPGNIRYDGLDLRIPSCTKCYMGITGHNFLAGAGTDYKTVSTLGAGLKVVGCSKKATQKNLTGFISACSECGMAKWANWLKDRLKPCGCCCKTLSWNLCDDEQVCEYDPTCPTISLGYKSAIPSDGDVSDSCISIGKGAILESNENIVFDLGSSSLLTEMNFEWCGLDLSNASTLFAVQISDDMVSWTNVATGQDHSTTTTVSIDMRERCARFVRIVFVRDQIVDDGITDITAQGTGSSDTFEDTSKYFELTDIPQSNYSGSAYVNTSMFPASNDNPSGSTIPSGYDGTITTAWQNNYNVYPLTLFSTYYEIDLGSNFDICGLMINWETPFQNAATIPQDYYAAEFSIETSTDGVSWSMIATYDPSVDLSPTNFISDLDFTMSNARYIRLLFKLNGSVSNDSTIFGDAKVSFSEIIVKECDFDAVADEIFLPTYAMNGDGCTTSWRPVLGEINDRDIPYKITFDEPKYIEEISIRWAGSVNNSSNDFDIYYWDSLGVRTLLSSGNDGSTSINPLFPIEKCTDCIEFVFKQGSSNHPNPNLTGRSPWVCEFEVIGTDKAVPSIQNISFMGQPKPKGAGVRSACALLTNLDTAFGDVTPESGGCLDFQLSFLVPDGSEYSPTYTSYDIPQSTNDSGDIVFEYLGGDAGEPVIAITKTNIEKNYGCFQVYQNGALVMTTAATCWKQGDYLEINKEKNTVSLNGNNLGASGRIPAADPCGKYSPLRIVFLSKEEENCFSLFIQSRFERCVSDLRGGPSGIPMNLNFISGGYYDDMVNDVFGTIISSSGSAFTYQSTSGSTQSVPLTEFSETRQCLINETQLEEYTPRTVRFGSTLTGPTCGVANIKVNYGDGSIFADITNQEIDHTYGQNGEYTGEIIVTFEDGTTQVEVFSVVIRNQVTAVDGIAPDYVPTFGVYTDVSFAYANNLNLQVGEGVYSPAVCQTFSFSDTMDFEGCVSIREKY